jgi:hypothetical protein
VPSYVHLCIRYLFFFYLEEKIFTPQASPASNQRVLLCRDCATNLNYTFNSIINLNGSTFIWKTLIKWQLINLYSYKLTTPRASTAQRRRAGP